jgi:hypothetical protein
MSQLKSRKENMGLMSKLTITKQRHHAIISASIKTLKSRLTPGQQGAIKMHMAPEVPMAKNTRQLMTMLKMHEQMRAHTLICEQIQGVFE